MGKKKTLINTTEVAVHLINKFADAIGWITIPKGEYMHKSVAEDHLIAQIENNDKIPPLVKSALISNVRKIIKEYMIQNDIFHIACDYLAVDSKPESVSDEWISCFLDNCKYSNNEYIKQIWGRLLAKECNENNSVPKSVIYILSSISDDNARAFTNLCKFAIKIPLKDGRDYNEPCIFWSGNEGFFRENGVNYGKLLELQTVGLVNMDIDGKYYISKDDIVQMDGYITIVYGETDLEVKINKRKLSVGNVVFTNAGAALYRIIAPETSDVVIDYLLNNFK